MSVTTRRLSAVKKRAALIAGAMVAAGLIAAGGGAAHATPADPGPGTASTAGNQSGNLPPAEPDYTAILKPGPPIELSNSEYGFIATHEVTKQLDRVNVVGGIAGLPVPPQYRAANDGLALQFVRALDGALSTPGGCIQMVISRGHAGSLFDYGLFAVEGQYCN